MHSPAVNTQSVHVTENVMSKDGALGEPNMTARSFTGKYWRCSLVQALLAVRALDRAEVHRVGGCRSRSPRPWPRSSCA